MYYNYHAQAKRKIMEGKLSSYKFVDEYNGIAPALVLYFVDSKPMPIRDYMWEEYLSLLIKFDNNN